MLILTDKAKEKIQGFMQERNPSEWGIQIKSQGPANFHFSLVQTDPLSPNDKIL